MRCSIGNYRKELGSFCEEMIRNLKLQQLSIWKMQPSVLLEILSLNGYQNES